MAPASVLYTLVMLQIAGDAIKKLLMVVTIFIGPVWCMIFAAQDMSSYQYEWATIWCFFAALQSFSAVLIEVYLYPRWVISSIPHAVCVLCV